MTAAVTEQNPITKEAQPPMPAQKQERPGSSAKMTPRPDYGEDSYKGSGKLAGRAAIITGADSGIGRAVALAFAREGADILISYLNEHQDAAQTERLVKDAGRKAVLVAGDIGDENHCHNLVQRAFDEFGKLDLLVNNAAYQSTHERIEDFSREEVEYTFRTNFFSMFSICQAAIPKMKPGSAIVNTTSIEAFMPEPPLMAYAPTKAAILNFTMGLSKQLAKKGIRVNAVAPGPIWTPLIPATMPEDSIEKFGKDTPLGRPGQPAELAPVYVLLASDEASYITGMVYGVTGGNPIF